MIQINNKKDCCGCKTCEEICPKQAISFKTDDEGFWYPNVDKQKCINCGLCEKVCPFLNRQETKHPLSVYAAINTNEEERLNSSSGGIFSMLMRQTIMDGGVVFGAAFNNEWQVFHTSAKSMEDAKKFQGSKYVQSNTMGCYKNVREALKCGQSVLFSGTACQVAGLKRFLGKEYENLMTVDVVCHGVPSPMVWNDYLNMLRQHKGTVNDNRELPINDISFRDKHNGWRRFAFVVRYSDSHSEIKNDGVPSANYLEVRESLYDNLFMKGFLNNLFLRPSCYACKAKSGKCGSDITLGDFWGVWNEMPDIDDDKGVSLLIVNTKKGDTAINRIKPSLRPVNYEQVVKYNICLEHSVPEPKWRNIFMRRYKNGEGINAINTVVKQMQPSWLMRIIGKIKRMILR
jgi:ferredoxin